MGSLSDFLLYLTAILSSSELPLSFGKKKLYDMKYISVATLQI